MPSVLRFLSAIRRECPRYTHIFSEKAQHLWRWISLQTFTRGRLVPRQPRAIKSTTRTELRNENIHIAKFIHWNTGTIPTALRRYNIQNCEYIHWNTGMTPTALHHEGIYIAIFIHRNTGITLTALPVGNTLNIGCLHLKNMNIFVDVFTFILQFFISTHFHFRPFTYNPQLAK